jgi:hypothetical protein
MPILTKQIINHLLSEAASISEASSVEYGTNAHLSEIDRIIDDVSSIKSGLRRGPNRNKYRKELYRLQSAIEALRYLRRRSRSDGIKSGLIKEGGLKIRDTDKKAKISPAIASEAIEIYLSIIDAWNRVLPVDKKVKPLRAVGSVSYYQEDILSKDSAKISYGDIDYLVQFPFDESFEGTEMERKSLQNKIKSEMIDLLSTFLSNGQVENVDVDETLRPGSSPLMVVIKLSDDTLVQVDTVVTFPMYKEWMGHYKDNPQKLSGRYTPEKGLKGMTTGNLYSALGNYFTLSVGAEGVQARIKDGYRVSPRMRKDVEIQTISTDIENFLIDIARYIGGDDIVLHPALLSNPGLSSDVVRISDFAKGIKGLALTLQDAEMENAASMLNDIKVSYDENLRGNAERKRDRGLPEDEFINLLKSNEKASDIVAQAFGI